VLTWCGEACAVLVGDSSNSANVERGSDWQKKLEIPAGSEKVDHVVFANARPNATATLSPFPGATRSKLSANVHS